MHYATIIIVLYFRDILDNRAFPMSIFT